VAFTNSLESKFHEGKRMKFNLFHKIFSAFLIMVLVAIIVPALVMHLSSNRRFAEYLTKMEIALLGDMVTALGSLYQKDQSWKQFQGEPGRWSQFISSYLPMIPVPHFPPPSSVLESAERRSEEESLQGKPLTRPQDRPNNGFLREFNAEGELKAGLRVPPPPFPGWILIGPRLALFDEKKNLVVGPGFHIQDYMLRPISVEGQTRGWLGLMPFRPEANPLNLAFVQEQTRSICLAGLCVFAIAGLISFFLSKHFVAPIKKLTEASRELSSLHFATQVDVRTSDEFGQLASAFNSMAQALEKNEMLRKQWTADVAHELRTPLAILRGEVEAMQDGVREITPERIASLHDEINRIGKLVDDLHILFVADSKTLIRQKHPVRPLDILQEVLGTFETRLMKAGIRLEANLVEDQGAVVMGDEDRLRQLFANLLENTIRYTDSPGLLRINHYCSLQQFTLVFEDSSPGVPPKALDRVFDRLYRVDKSRSRASGGGGLGLSICKEIVIGHDGAIRASHSSLGGFLISIEFPLKKT
jgi:two-component system, OmpR family, sensor histidine kinase BaeS